MFKVKDRVVVEHMLFNGVKHGGVVVAIDADGTYLVTLPKDCVGDYGHNGGGFISQEQRDWIIQVFGRDTCLWAAEENLELIAKGS